MFGMSWDMTAFKAYIGGVVATAGVPIGTFVLKLLESGFQTDFSSQIDMSIIGGVAYVIGHIGVYFAKNKLA